MSLPRERRQQLQDLRTARGRREQRAFLIEGEKLIREALAARARVRELFATADRHGALLALHPAAPLTSISTADAERLSDTRTPQGCFALVDDDLPDAATLLAALPPAGPLVVVALDRIQDPGNVGALIRVAAAFEADAVFCGPGAADPTHPRVLRAATGAWFHVPLARCDDLPAVLDALHAAGCARIGAAADGPPLHAAPDPGPRRAIVFGSEGAGFSPGVEAHLDARIAVPIDPAVESLNVAVAAGVILHAWRHPRP